jgi:hypothetical protein
MANPDGLPAVCGAEFRLIGALSDMCALLLLLLNPLNPIAPPFGFMLLLLLKRVMFLEPPRPPLKDMV